MSEAFCTGCGSALAPGSAFCGSCGAAVNARAPDVPQPPATDAPVYAPPPAPQAAAPPAPSAPPVYSPPPVQPAAAPYSAPPTPAPTYQAQSYAAPPPAPAYAPPPSFQPGAYAQPGAAIEPGNEPFVRAYVGPNADLYLGKWRAIAAAGKPNSWNWAAFLLNAFWLVYRRMWTPAMGALAAILVLNMLGMLMPALRALTSGLTLGTCAFVGWRGNAMYRDHAERAIAQSAAVTPDPNGRMAWLQTQGGVSMLAAIGAAVGFVLVWYLALFLMIRESGLGSRSRTYGSSSYGAPASPSSSGSGLTQWS